MYLPQHVGEHERLAYASFGCRGLRMNKKINRKCVQLSRIHHELHGGRQLLNHNSSIYLDAARRWHIYARVRPSISYTQAWLGCLLFLSIYKWNMSSRKRQIARRSRMNAKWMNKICIWNLKREKNGQNEMTKLSCGYYFVNHSIYSIHR